MKSDSWYLNLSTKGLISTSAKGNNKRMLKITWGINTPHQISLVWSNQGVWNWFNWLRTEASGGVSCIMVINLLITQMIFSLSCNQILQDYSLYSDTNPFTRVPVFCFITLIRYRNIIRIIRYYFIWLQPSYFYGLFHGTLNRC